MALIVNATKNKTKSQWRCFKNLMKVFVIGVGIAIPIVFGYWRFSTSSEPNKLLDGIGVGILSVPFSFGLWLSTTQIGRNYRYLTLGLIVLGAIVHIIFSVYPFWFLPIVILIESYAAYSLFTRVED